MPFINSHLTGPENAHQVEMDIVVGDKTQKKRLPIIRHTFPSGAECERSSLTMALLARVGGSVSAKVWTERTPEPEFMDEYHLVETCEPQHPMSIQLAYSLTTPVLQVL